MAFTEPKMDCLVIQVLSLELASHVEIKQANGLSAVFSCQVVVPQLKDFLGQVRAGVGIGQVCSSFVKQSRALTQHIFCRL